MTLYLVQVNQALFNNLYGLHEVVLRYHQGRGEADAVKYLKFYQTRPLEDLRVDVGRLRQETPTLEEEAELPGSSTSHALGFINHNSIQQTPSPNFLHQGIVYCTNSLTEFLSELFCPLCKVFLDEHLKRGDGDRAA